MAFLSAITPLLGTAVSEPSGAWVFFIQLFRNPAFSYGWSVIIFTILLRLVLLPLDFYQKKVSYDNKKKTEAMEPYMEKLRKQYGGDKMAMSVKQRELQKKFKYNTFGPCLPAILSLFIFITLFGGFRKIADYEIYKAYNDTKVAYVASYVSTDTAKYGAASELYNQTIEDILAADENFSKSIDLDETDFFNFITNTDYIVTNDGGEIVGHKMAFDNNNTNLITVVTAQNADADKIYDVLLKTLAQNDAAVKYKEDVRPSQRFLWIKNMWRPDAVYGMNGCSPAIIEPVIPSDKLYLGSLTSCASDYKSLSEYKKTEATSIGIEYSIVMKQVIAENNRTSNGKTAYNGYYVLAVLIIGLSILSTKFNAAGNPMPAPNAIAGGADGGANPKAPNMKMMMYMMPVMMGFFAVSSNSAFSLYMVASTGTSLLSTLLCGWLIKLYDKKKTAMAGGNKFQRYEKKPTARIGGNKPNQQNKSNQQKSNKNNKKK